MELYGARHFIWHHGLPEKLSPGSFDATPSVSEPQYYSSQATQCWEIIMGRKYESIVETIGNTPVVRINRVAPHGVNVFVKIEAFNPLGSVKDRLALGGN